MVEDKELIEELAREFERAATKCYCWTDEQFEIWWKKDSRSVSNRRQQRKRARLAIKFCRANL